jgi:hypothetical protein
MPATKTRSRRSSSRSPVRTEFPAPRWATRRSPDRPTLGGRVADIADAIGTPLMPWQRYVVDVALEINPDTGLLAYRTVLVSVPRQSGKTTLGLSVMTHRALAFGEPQRIIYTAQTRNDARRKWEDDHVVRLEQSPLTQLFTVRKSNGSEAIKWANGSMQGITSTTEKAGHGETIDLSFIDEAFSLPDDRLEQALRPAMITRPQPQMWIVSTAGTKYSHFLNEKQLRGRELVEQDVTSDFAYFEWSAPEGAELHDPDVWWSFHPAVGLTIDAKTLSADALAMSTDEAQRAYFNWRNDGAVEGVDTPLDPVAWFACEDAVSVPVGRVAFAVDVTPDRSRTSVCVAGGRSDGLPHVELVESRSGTGWVADWVADRLRAHPNVGVVLDPAGPAGSLVPEFQARGVDLALTTTRDFAHACAAFADAVNEQRVRHIGQEQLSAAVAGARRRPLGEAWAWTRKDTSVDLSPLVGATLALWKLSQPVEAAAPAPRVVSLSDL